MQENTVSIYMEHFFAMWFNLFPVPRRKYMLESTYEKRVDERKQVSIYCTVNIGSLTGHTLSGYYP